MIEFINQRYEPDGRLCGDPVIRNLTVGKGVTMLTRLDLGWGGRIISIDRTHIRTRTSCMGFGVSRYDITDYKGTEEEMEPLLATVACWVEVKGSMGERVTNAATKTALKANLTKPLQLGMLSVLFQGSFTFPVLCAVAHLNEEQAKALKQMADDYVEQQLEMQKNKRYGYRPTRQSILQDFVDPIIEMVIEGATFEECMEIAA